MDDIKKEPSALKRDLISMWKYLYEKKQYLTPPIIVLLTIVFLKGFLFVEDRVSLKMYQFCIVLFIVIWGFGLFAISKHEEKVRNKNQDYT